MSSAVKFRKFKSTFQKPDVFMCFRRPKWGRAIRYECPVFQGTMELAIQQDSDAKRTILRWSWQQNWWNRDDVPKRAFSVLQNRLFGRACGTVELREGAIVTTAPNTCKAIIRFVMLQDDKMSMFVILPRKRQTLQMVLNLLARMPIEKLIEILADAEQQFVDEDVEVYLPRFDTNSDLNLNLVLQQVYYSQLLLHINYFIFIVCNHFYVVDLVICQTVPPKIQIWESFKFSCYQHLSLIVRQEAQNSLKIWLFENWLLHYFCNILFYYVFIVLDGNNWDIWPRCGRFAGHCS